MHSHLQHLKTHRQDYHVPLSQEQASSSPCPNLVCVESGTFNRHTSPQTYVHSQDLETQGSSLNLKQEQAPNLVQSVLKVVAIQHPLDTIVPCIHSQCTGPGNTGRIITHQEPASSNPVLICVDVGGGIQVVSQHTRSGSQISK